MIKLSTMQKLFGLSLILSLFTVAIGMYSVSSLNRLSDDIDTLYKVHVKGLDLTRALNIEALRMLREEKNIILTNEADEIQRYLDMLGKDRSKFEGMLKDLPKFFQSGEGKELCSKVLLSAKAWLALHDKVIELGKTSDAALNEQAQQLSANEARKAMAVMAQDMQKVVDFKLMRTDQLNESSTKMYESSRLITILGIIASVLVGIGLGFLMARNMLRQLGDEPASLSQLALAIAGGDLNARFDPPGQRLACSAP